MSNETLTQSQFYDIYKAEVQSQAGEFTDFNEGSMHDILNGALSTCFNELSELIVSEFMKTFFDLAEGNDLDRLAVDHFGDTFSRPNAAYATGLAVFSRPNTDNGNCVIEAGTIIKTKKNSSGVEYRFKTDTQVTMTGISASVSITAMDAGSTGNVVIGALNVIESSLTDSSIVVTNPSATAGGDNAMEDAEYREWIKQKILALVGATLAAVQAAALAVDGVSYAVPIIEKKVVIEYDIALEQILAGATYFTIPYPVLYVADENGNSSQALIDSVKAAIALVKACGVEIKVKGAIAISIDWSASLTLNPAGPNYGTLQSDLTIIKDAMSSYINEKIAIGSGFNKTSANNYIMSLFGPEGTGDITSFNTSVPAGNVAGNTGTKLIAGTMEIY